MIVRCTTTSASCNLASLVKEKNMLRPISTCFTTRSTQSFNAIRRVHVNIFKASKDLPTETSSSSVTEGLTSLLQDGGPFAWKKVRRRQLIY